jgi:hypothetical protein
MNQINDVKLLTVIASELSIDQGFERCDKVVCLLALVACGVEASIESMNNQGRITIVANRCGAVEILPSGHCENLSIFKSKSSRLQKVLRVVCCDATICYDVLRRARTLFDKRSNKRSMNLCE